MVDQTSSKSPWKNPGRIDENFSGIRSYSSSVSLVAKAMKHGTIRLTRTGRNALCVPG